MRPKPRASSTSLASGEMMSSSAGSDLVIEKGLAGGRRPVAAHLRTRRTALRLHLCSGGDQSDHDGRGPAEGLHHRKSSVVYACPPLCASVGGSHCSAAAAVTEPAGWLRRLVRRGEAMAGRNRCAYSVLVLFVFAASLSAQRPAVVLRQEKEQAAREVPKLSEVLSLKPGMSVADVGSGGGAMAVRMAGWLGPDGHVFATDVRDAQLAEIRENVAREGRTNVVVLEGAARSTNLPNECCDAIFLRDVYHHLTHPQEFDVSLFAALKPGGRLAIIDFQPEPGSSIPDSVPRSGADTAFPSR